MAGKMDERIRCSFCNKPENHVRKLIAGPAGAYICDECIEICMDIIRDELGDDPYMDEDDGGEGSLHINLLKPRQIKDFLGLTYPAGTSTVETATCHPKHCKVFVLGGFLVLSLGVQLIYNTVLVSDVQQSDSVLCIFSQIIFHYRLLL